MPISERLGDVEGIIAVLVKTSRIRIAKGIDTQEAFDRVLEDLRKAYSLARKVGRLDFVCAAAADLGMHMLGAGGAAEAKPLLIEARDGLIKLQQRQTAEQIDQVLQQIDSAA